MEAKAKAEAKTFAFEVFEDIARVRASDGRPAPEMAIIGVCVREDCGGDLVMTVADKEIWDKGDDRENACHVIDWIQAETRQTAGYFLDCLGYVIVRINAYENGVLVGTILESEDMHTE